MEDTNLKMAQQDIDDALKTVEDLEMVASQENLSKDILREKFISLNEKVKNLENILKTEGII
ncbi:hypothetical protein NNC19_06645 [Clostridium sp. SHJSY1]|uniref:hypothetical protein n=1 Tax=Clostridium sp. SHJSY1 TaxID=2942483 RepID=UPI0028769223|nr:hypothetical protein [Clostridium sp. SHJSY1]MDS0525350.1 hypothetical protein [Clostridium sp. SHJSY1]